MCYRDLKGRPEEGSSRCAGAQCKRERKHFIPSCHLTPCINRSNLPSSWKLLRPLPEHKLPEIRQRPQESVHQISRTQIQRTPRASPSFPHMSAAGAGGFRTCGPIVPVTSFIVPFFPVLASACGISTFSAALVNWRFCGFLVRSKTYITWKSPSAPLIVFRR